MIRASNKLRRAAVMALALLGVAAPALAQTPLSDYMDKNGYVDVQALTCRQLASTFQEDADYLAAWYSGWYSGLAKKHLARVERVKSGEHKLIVYCKAHQDETIIHAIGILMKDDGK
jgi:hypothetical protein